MNRAIAVSAACLLAILSTGCPAEDACTPACREGYCGTDGCGGFCPCPDGTSCNTATQSCCQPSCGGRDCGDDGCGGSCGACTNGAVCNPLTGRCQGGCVPACEGRECGSDGCGGTCGTCGNDRSCNEATGRCGGTCQPDCASSLCGTDGCGGSCGTCPDGAECRDGDCVALASCDDLVRDGDESDTDCGGSCDAKCRVGRRCGSPSDCTSARCELGLCAAGPACSNSGQDAGETDKDCGGPDCAPCAKGKYCQEPADCLTGACVFGVCELPTCDDGLRDQGETGVDCGGPCDGCDDGARCIEAGDCSSGDCSLGFCVSCHDGKRNGTESDEDCGGGRCAGCADGDACRVAGDCAGGGCEDKACCTANACGFCGATSQEVCDGRDNDCDDQTDEDVGKGAACPKQDGVCEGSWAQCRGEAGWVCDGTVYALHDHRYAADEKLACSDGVDNDCDGKADAKDVQDCCRPACGSRVCGDDGCGGTCGTCGATETCGDDGTCLTACGAFKNQTCQGGFCGQDYGVGDCYCTEYMCSLYPEYCCPDFVACCGTCQAACDGRECGDDGCGGTCGTCPGGATCSDAGTCETVACGSDYYNSCTGYCGQAWNDWGYCQCDAGCATDPAGCCADWSSCCTVPANPCLQDSTFSCCKGGNQNYYCANTALSSLTCDSASGETCGWYPGDELNLPGYYCADASLLQDADPSGKHPRNCTF